MSYSGVFDELVSIAKATWTEVTDAQIFTRAESMKRNIIEVTTGENPISYPLVVIDCFGFGADTLSPVGTDGRMMPLMVHYITTQRTIGSTPGPEKYCIEKAALFQQAMDFHPLHSTFRVVEFGNISSSASTLANLQIGIEGKTELWIGTVTYATGIRTGVGGY